MSELTQPDALTVLSSHFQHTTMANLRFGANILGMTRIYHDPQTIWIKIASRVAACMVQVAATAKVTGTRTTIPIHLLEHEDPATATLNAQVAFAVSDFYHCQCDANVKSDIWTEAFDAINQECEDWGYERMRLPGFIDQNGTPVKDRGTCYDDRQTRFKEYI
jgi:hypothetical protein